MNERKPKTHGSKSKLISIRFPNELEEELKLRAKEMGMPWQTFMKDLLFESLGLNGGVEVITKSSAALMNAKKKIR